MYLLTAPPLILSLLSIAVLGLLNNSRGLLRPTFESEPYKGGR
jgi:hypothetical protein